MADQTVPGRCPNTPPCEHPAMIHDVSGDPEDPKPMCCADGCSCGQPAGAELAAEPGPVPFACLTDTSNDMQAFVELPECTACQGSGKNTTGSPFEDAGVHPAGPPMHVGNRVRQLCGWCGYALLDRTIGQPETWESFPEGQLVRVDEDGTRTVVDYQDAAELPARCCTLRIAEKPTQSTVDASEGAKG